MDAFGDVDATAADHRAPASAGAQFSQGHANRHCSHSSRCWRVAPRGTVSSFTLVNARKVQNKLLSAMPLRRLNHICAYFSRPGFLLAWLMFYFGTKRVFRGRRFMNIPG
jgi:hypothetical protein